MKPKFCQANIKLNGINSLVAATVAPEKARGAILPVNIRAVNIPATTIPAIPR